jgi:hypothetical protein
VDQAAAGVHRPGEAEDEAGELLLHPAVVAARAARLAREAHLTGDPQLATLLRELAALSIEAFLPAYRVTAEALRRPA